MTSHMCRDWLPCVNNCKGARITHFVSINDMHLPEGEQDKTPVRMPYGWCYERPCLLHTKFPGMKRTFTRVVLPLHKRRMQIAGEIAVINLGMLELQDYIDTRPECPTKKRKREEVTERQVELKRLEAELNSIKMPQWATDWTGATPIPVQVVELLDSDDDDEDFVPDE